MFTFINYQQGKKKEEKQNKTNPCQLVTGLLPVFCSKIVKYRSYVPIFLWAPKRERNVEQQIRKDHLALIGQKWY